MDLNIIVYKNKTFDSKNQMIEKLNRALNLGFRTIALTVDIESNDIKNIPSPPLIQTEGLDHNLSDLTIKTRLNVKVDDYIQSHRLNQSENAKKYHLLSIEPLNDKILSHLNNGNFECDLITFNLSDKMCPNIRRANFSLPISKGIGLEINYGNCLLDQTTRRSVLAFGQILVEKTKSKNIILSSGALNKFSLRAPKDVIYLGLMFGLNEDQSKASVFRNPIKVVKHSEIRKNVNMVTIRCDSNDNKISDEWLNKEFNKRYLNQDLNTAKKFKI